MIEIIGPALSQWDVGRSVKVTNIEADHFHFANKGDLKAVVMKNADTHIKIPDYLLQTGKQLCVYAVKDGITVESKIFYVNGRERPEHYVYEDDQRNYIYELITNAEMAIAAANHAAEAARPAADNANAASVNANNAAVSANEAAKNANEAAAKAAHTAKSLMVVGKTEGANIYLDDAIEQYLVGLRIFGKTIQEGTPAPDAPVDLVSVGDDWTVGVTVVGKNLADITKATPTGTERITVKNDTIVIDAGAGIYGVKLNGVVLAVGRTYTMSVGNVSQHDVNFGFRIIYNDDTSSNTYGDRSLLTLTVTKPIKAVYFYVGYGLTATSQIVVTQLQIEEGATRTAYEPYKAQSLTVSTPNGLPGIPVTSGGNYIDENGQQWICDEIDFDRGVYIQRINIVGFENAIGVREFRSASNNTYRFTFPIGTNPTFLPSAQGIGMCNAFTYSYAPVGSNDIDNTIHAYMSGGIYARCDTYETVSDFLAWAKNIDLKVQYILATPIETPLTAEELAAYASLHTYRNNTTLSNEAGAYMELEYVMDAKKYIDRMLQPPAVRVVKINLFASAWVGSGNLYSQVVSIDGVTKNTQVNLTPSVQQLSIFYEKDITFSTENDGGIITVYVIGQKPENDYTIQASIVEVIT